MFKRHSEDIGDVNHINKRLKTLERMIMRSRRPRARVIESSSSEASSREPSPTSKNLQGEENQRDRTALIVTLHGPNSDVEPGPSYAVAERTATATAVAAAVDEARATTSTPPAAENVLDSALLEILGDDPSATIQYGPDIHKDLASRFEHLATNGLDKNVRKELVDKYPIPGNCGLIGAPILNAEIKAALPDSMYKRDKAIEARQKQLATAITVLGAAMTDHISSVKNKDHELIKKLMDTARLLCDIQYAESITRRNFAMFSLKKDLKENLSTSKVDKYLFGENLTDTLKAAKAVNKSGAELKVINKVGKKSAVQTQKPQGNKGLNWKAPAPQQQRRPTGAGAQKNRVPATTTWANRTRAAASRPSSPPRRRR